MTTFDPEQAETSRWYKDLNCGLYFETYFRAAYHSCSQAGATNRVSKGLKHCRIDPAGCGCTDCITGFSVPIDEANLTDFDNYLGGLVRDASATTEYAFDQYIERLEMRQ